MKVKAYRLVAAAVVISMAVASCKSESKIEDTQVPEEVEMETIEETSTPTVQIDTVGYTTTASGLKYKVKTEGTGVKPSAEDQVTVHYTGKLLNGTVFDSSVERGQPTAFPLNAVIKGWTEGLQLMNEGSTYEFIIPSELAYGETGTPGGPIGPNEDLYFEVQLIKVN